MAVEGSLRPPPSLKKLEAMYEKAAKARKPLDVEWVLDAAFYCGQHYTEYNQRAGRFQEVERPANRPNAPRPVANKIYSLTMDAYASARAVEPTVELLPLNSDAMEISNARVGQAWLDHVCSPTQANWQARRDAALFWTALVGEGWLKWTISGDAKRIVIEACSPLEIYADPTPSSSLDCRWIIHVRGMDPEDVFDLFGVELDASEVDPQDVLKQKVLREIGMVNGTPTVTVKELWELPCRRYPNGRHIIWAAQRVLLDEDFPYKHKMLPFTQIGHSPIPGTKHFMSGTRTARPLNMELNLYHAQKIIARQKHANFKWFADASLELDADPDDSDDQVLHGNTRNGQLPPPAILQATAWPDSQDGVWINEELQNAVGLHDASQGQAPGRVDSASGIEQLQEADRGRLSEVESTLKTAIARGFGMMISLAKQYMKGEQVVPVYGAKGAPQVARFLTEQFPDEPLMRVITGGGLPKNRAARRQEVISMWSAGLLGEDPHRALQMLDYPADLNLTGEERDELEATAENMLMLSGVPVTPKPWQNHELHRRIHNEARKSAEFASATDEVWSMFDHHEAETDTAELDEMRQEAERQQAIKNMLESVIPPELPAPVGPEGAVAAPGGEPVPAVPAGQELPPQQEVTQP